MSKALKNCSLQMFHHIMCEEEVAAPESASDLYAEVGVTESERSSVSELGVCS